METGFYKKFGFWLEFLAPVLIGFIFLFVSKKYNLQFPSDQSTYSGVLSSSISLCAIIAGLSGVILALFPTIANAAIFQVIKKKKLEIPVFLYVGFSILISCSLIIYNIVGYFHRIQIPIWMFLMSSMLINFFILILALSIILVDIARRS